MHFTQSIKKAISITLSFLIVLTTIPLSAIPIHAEDAAIAITSYDGFYLAVQHDNEPEPQYYELKTNTETGAFEAESTINVCEDDSFSLVYLIKAYRDEYRPVDISLIANAQDMDEISIFKFTWTNGSTSVSTGNEPTINSSQILSDGINDISVALDIKATGVAPSQTETVNFSGKFTFNFKMKNVKEADVLVSLPEEYSASFNVKCVNTDGDTVSGGYIDTNTGNEYEDIIPQIYDMHGNRYDPAFIVGTPVVSGTIKFKTEEGWTVDWYTKIEKITNTATEVRVDGESDVLTIYNGYEASGITPTDPYKFTEDVTPENCKALEGEIVLSVNDDNSVKLDKDDTGRAYIDGNTLYIVYEIDRPEASDSDYEIVGSYNGYVAKPTSDTEYTIKAKNGNKVSLTQNPPGADEITVTLTPDGHTTTFYEVKNGIASEPIIDAIKIDETAPQVSNIKTEAANGEVKVLDHGIYSKQKAELLVTVEITETESGLKTASLIGEDKDGNIHEYPKASEGKKDGKTVYTFAIESQEVMLKEKLSFVAEDNVGNKSEKILLRGTDDPSTVTLEMIPPEVGEITSDPKANDNGWYNRYPSLSVEASDVGSGIANIRATANDIELYSKDFTNKVTDAQKSDFDLTEDAYKQGINDKGEYRIVATVTDNSGNINSSEITIKIDTDAPKVVIEGADEGAHYVEVPKITLNEDEKHYTEDGNRINVSVTCDGKKTLDTSFRGVNTATVPTDAFKNDGDYIVTVYAEDAAGNRSEEKTLSFVKDSTAPVSSISGPAEGRFYNKDQSVTVNVKERYYDTNTVDVKVTRTFRGEEEEIAFPWENKGETSTSSISLTKSGTYTVKVNATDKAGNRAEEKVLKFYIDKIAPVLSISGGTKGKHYRVSPTLKLFEEEDYWRFNENKMSAMVVRDGNKEYEKTFTKVNELTIGPSIMKKDGEYTVKLNGVDPAGNKGKEATFTFVKDSIAPRVTIQAPGDRWHTTPQSVKIAVTERWYKTNKVTITVVRDNNGKKYSYTFPWKNSGVSSSSSMIFRDTGKYTVTVSAIDEAGNKSDTKTAHFSIDTVAPELTLGGVEEGKVYSYDDIVAPFARFSDDYLSGSSYTITKGDKNWAENLPGIKGSESITWPDFDKLRDNDGLYNISVTVTDEAGNAVTKAISFIVNRFGSWFEYNEAVKNIRGKALQRVTEDLVITEHNYSKLEKYDTRIYRDGKLLTEKGETTRDEKDNKNTYKHIYAASLFEAEGAYEINVVSKDNAGNSMESKGENGEVKFYVDRTAPTLSLSGIDPKGNKGEELRIPISASDLLTGVKELKAYVNDEEVSITRNENSNETYFTIGKGLNQEIKVVAEDGAGNRSEVTDIASVSNSGFSLFFNRFKKAIAGISALILALVGGFLFFLAKRRKKDEEEDEE